MNGFYQFITEKLYKDRLNPKFWDENQKFDDRLAKIIVKICNDFTEQNKLDQYIQDITLTGSLANYNYTRFSDLDIHLMLDFKDINDDVELVKSSLDGKRFVWNLRHDIMLKGHEIELYFQNTNEPHIASGIYSILNNEWIKKPIYDPPTVDMEYVKHKTGQYKKEIDTLQDKLQDNSLQRDNFDDLYKRAIKLREKITRMRKDSLLTQGEYGIGNLTFKNLRNTGYIEKIINLSNQAYDKIYTENHKYF